MIRNDEYVSSWSKLRRAGLKGTDGVMYYGLNGDSPGDGNCYYHALLNSGWFSLLTSQVMKFKQNLAHFANDSGREVLELVVNRFAAKDVTPDMVIKNFLEPNSYSGTLAGIMISAWTGIRIVSMMLDVNGLLRPVEDSFVLLHQVSPEWNTDENPNTAYVFYHMFGKPLEVTTYGNHYAALFKMNDKERLHKAQAKRGSKGSKGMT